MLLITVERLLHLSWIMLEVSFEYFFPLYLLFSFKIKLKIAILKHTSDSVEYIDLSHWFAKFNFNLLFTDCNIKVLISVFCNSGFEYFVNFTVHVVSLRVKTVSAKILLLVWFEKVRQDRQIM